MALRQGAHGRLCTSGRGDQEGTEDKLGICCNSHVSDDGDLTKVSEVEAMGIDLSLEIF